MTMHLEGPWLSLNGKKKGKMKFKSAEAKRESERLDQEWRDLLKRQGAELEQKKRARAMKAEPLTYTLSAPPGRSTSNNIKSHSTGEVGTSTYRNSPVYTGTKVKGIGTMHKSNAVPVFSDEEAHDIATMRRG